MLSSKTKMTLVAVSVLSIGISAAFAAPGKPGPQAIWDAIDDLQSQIDSLSGTPSITELKTYRNFEIFDIPDTGIHTFYAYCESGDIATGGGFGQEPLVPPVVQIINSFPTDPTPPDLGDFPTGWGLTVTSSSPLSSDISVQVVCLDIMP